VKKWQAFGLARRLEAEKICARGCPICGSPMKLADGEAEKLAEANLKSSEQVADIIGSGINLRTIPRLRNVQTKAGAVFLCTREDCVFNEEH